MNYPKNTDDIIDSRDVIDAIDEAYAEYEAACEAENLDAHDEHMWFVSGCPEGPLPSADPNMVALVKLAAEGEDTSEDWQHGAPLIRDSYFEDYARELVEDCGYFATPRGVDWGAWPYRCIDWEQVARELRMDYTPVDFDGVTYWVR